MPNFRLRIGRLAVLWFVCGATLGLLATLGRGQEQKPPDHSKHHGGFMQGGKHHLVAKDVTLEEKMDSLAHTITLREGPLTLPAKTEHMSMPQPRALFWSVPVDGWLLSYKPKLVDASGQAVPGRMLHHVAWWNTSRSDFLCPNKEEHIFGAGGELTTWREIPGYGYRVEKGDRIRIETMVHNPTDIAYDHVFLEVEVRYAEANSAEPIKNVYPAWMDVQSCGGSGYDLPAGESQAVGTVPVRYDGVLLGVGGHMHDYAKEIVLQDDTRQETVATLDPRVDTRGHLLSMPVVTFDKGGYRLRAGDQLKITATYDNPTGKLLPEGAMGIVVGYFAPADDSLTMALRRKPKFSKHEMAGMDHHH